MTSHQNKQARNTSAKSTRRQNIASFNARPGEYEEWSKNRLEQCAEEMGIKGRKKMSRGQLIEAIKNH